MERGTHEPGRRQSCAPGALARFWEGLAASIIGPCQGSRLPRESALPRLPGGQISLMGSLHQPTSCLLLLKEKLPISTATH